jgi:hypothetical protein
VAADARAEGVRARDAAMRAEAQARGAAAELAAAKREVGGWGCSMLSEDSRAGMRIDLDTECTCCCFLLLLLQTNKVSAAAADIAALLTFSSLEHSLS